MKAEIVFDGKRTLYVSSPVHGTRIFLTDGEKIEDGVVDFIKKVLFT